MGKIVKQFGNLSFQNEAEVSQNFLIPLLTDFLEYKLPEIQPEYLLPPIRIPLNRNHSNTSAAIDRRAKPDYIVTLNKQERVVSCDSKGPDEDIDEYLDQLRAYCIASGSNLLLITNGIKLKIYDGNRLVFETMDIADLDIKSNELYKLLARRSVIESSEIQRIQAIDLSITLAKQSMDIDRSISLKISDYIGYLNSIVANSQTIDIPEPIREAFNIEPSQFDRFPPQLLYSFIPYTLAVRESGDDNPLTYRALLEEDFSTLVIIGESGIGKSTLASQILFDRAHLCLSQHSDLIPVLIKLNQVTARFGILELISLQLASRGVKITSSIEKILYENRFLILLDAFDEVLDIYLSNVEREVNTILENYPNCKLIITTRHFRVPKVARVKRYELARLSQQKIEEFSKTYLASSAGRFLELLNSLNLSHIASNTLTLMLLIFLYLNDGTLPKTRGLILKQVVLRVFKYNQEKMSRNQVNIPSAVLEQALRELSKEAIRLGPSYVLDNEIIDSTLIKIVSIAEQNRLIAPTLTIENLMDQLAATGFIYRSSEGTSFWHRVFVEYFAAMELIDQENNLLSQIETIAMEVRWAEILPLCALYLKDADYFIAHLLQVNLFAAAKSAKEVSIIDSQIYNQIIDGLEKRCFSSMYNVRRMAVHLLTLLKGDQATEALFRLLNIPFVDVKCEALLEISRRQSLDAREIIFNHVVWDVPREVFILGLGGSITAVVDALSEFDDIEAQGEILAIWRRKPDIFTSQTCSLALQRIHKRAKLNPQIVEEIFSFFKTEMTDKDSKFKLWNISDLLENILDYRIVERLISLVGEAEQTNTLSIATYASEVLSAYEDKDLVSKFIHSYKDPNTTPYGRELFAQILSKTKAPLPIEVIYELTESSNYKILSLGILALKRLSLEEAKDILLSAINPPSELEDLTSYAQVQKTVFEVLVHFNALYLLLEEDNRFQIFYNISMETLFKGIRQTKQYNLLPIIDKVLNNFDDPNVAIEGAWTYAELGFLNEAELIIRRVLSRHGKSAEVIAKILGGVQKISSESALGFIKQFLDLKIQRHNYIRHECIEALGRIGTQEACDLLRDLTIESLQSPHSSLDVEHCLRNIQPYVFSSSEQWLIDLLNTRKLERHDLRRALETLGEAGTIYSVPVLSSYLESSDMNIQFLSFWAITEIYRREGRLWYNGEEKLTLTKKLL